MTRPTAHAPTRLETTVGPDILAGLDPVARPDRLSGLDSASRSDTLTRPNAVGQPDAVTRPDAAGRVDCVILRPEPAGRLTGQPRDAALVAEAVEGLRAVFDQLGGRLALGGVVWLDVTEPATTAGADATGLAWRMALAVQRDGWILRNAITCTPDPAAPDAIGASTLFLLTRQRRYHFALPTRADALPSVAGARAMAAWPAPACLTDGRRRCAAAPARQRRTTRRSWHASGFSGGSRTGAGGGAVAMNPGDVWRLAAENPGHGERGQDSPRCRCAPAAPRDVVGGLVGGSGSVILAARAILLGCPPGGLVHDPLAGCAHGPVARAAVLLGRRFQAADRPVETPPVHVGSRLGQPRLSYGIGR